MNTLSTRAKNEYTWPELSWWYRKQTLPDLMRYARICSVLPGQQAEHFCFMLWLRYSFF